MQSPWGVQPIMPVYAARTIPPVVPYEMEARYGGRQLVALDIETTGPSPEKHDLMAVAMATYTMVKSTSPYSDSLAVLPKVHKWMWCSMRPPGMRDEDTPDALEEVVNGYSWDEDTRANFWEATPHMKGMLHALVGDSVDYVHGLTAVAKMLADTVTLGPDGQKILPTIVAKPVQFDCVWLASRMSRLLNGAYKEELSEEQREDLMEAVLVLSSRHSICLQTRMATALHTMGQDTRSISTVDKIAGGGEPEVLTEFQSFAMNVRRHLNPLLGCPIQPTHHPAEDVAGQISDSVTIEAMQLQIRLQLQQMAREAGFGNVAGPLPPLASRS